MSLRDKLPSVSVLQERLTSLKDNNKLRSGASLNFYVPKPKRGQPANTAIIRILPHPKYNFDSFIKTYVHYNLGDNVPIECTKENGLEDGCAICEHRQELYNMAAAIATEAGIVDQKSQEGYKAKMEIPECKHLHEVAKQIRPVLRVQVPVIVRGKEAEGVKFWGIAEKVYDDLFASCVKAAAKYSSKNPLDPWQGVDIEISVKMGDRYAETTCDVQVGDNPSKCLEGKTDEEIEAVINSLPDVWGTVCKKISYSKTEEIINDLMTPSGVIDISRSDEEEDEANDETTASVGATTENVETTKTERKVSRKPSSSHTVSSETKKVQAEALSEIDELSEEI